MSTPAGDGERWPDPLIVDAFNCMRSGWPWASPAKLVEACVGEVEETGIPHIVVFDGRLEDGLSRSIPEGVWVELVESAPRTADDVIVELAERMSAEGFAPTVATSDRGLRARLALPPHCFRGGGAYARHLGLH